MNQDNLKAARAAYRATAAYQEWMKLPDGQRKAWLLLEKCFVLTSLVGYAASQEADAIAEEFGVASEDHDGMTMLGDE